ALKDAMRALQSASAEASALMMDPADQLLDANADMNRALAKLADAIQSADPMKIEDAQKDVAAAARRQLILVKPLANSKTGAAERESLLEAARRLADAMKALSLAGDALQKNTRDPKLQSALRKAIQDLDNAGLGLAANALSETPEDAMIAN